MPLWDSGRQLSDLWSALIPALLAGVCMFLWVSSPAAQAIRAAHGEVDAADEATPSRWAALLATVLGARPDASPLRQRVAVSLLGAGAIGLAVHGLTTSPALVSWVLVPVLSLTGVVMLGRLEPAEVRQRQHRLVTDLPQALELMSACLAAGMPLRRATRAVATVFEGPVSDDLGRVLTMVDLGVSDVDAWRSLRTDPHWGAAAVDLARSVESGTMMVEVLVHHARDARTRRRAELEVRAKAVGVRSVLPLMTCFLPAFMLIGVVPTVASAVRNALF